MTLTLSTGTFDKVNTFAVEVPSIGGPRRITCKLYLDEDDNGKPYYYGLQKGCCVARHYSDADRAERSRLESQVPVRDGDIVTIANASYVARVKGDYSNAVDFDLVEAGR
jgi:hypothetical protein